MSRTRHAYTPPTGGLIKREHARWDTGRLILGQLRVAPQRVHPCFVPRVARAGSHSQAIQGSGVAGITVAAIGQTMLATERRANESCHSVLHLTIGMVSIIIPTYNEAGYIAATLGRLGEAGGNFEVIVADGNSTDGTCELVRRMIPGFPQPLRIIQTVRNRAMQLNCAGSVARGDTFLFLHADVTVPATAIEALEKCLESEPLVGGNFQIVFEGNSSVERFFTWAYRVRRPFGIYYGDSGIFVRRAVFERLEGFRPIPIMDDYEFVRRLERAGPTVCLEPALRVSDRRWRVQGLFRTLLSWVCIQTLYSLGVPAQRLARWYGPVRNGNQQG